MEDSDRRSKMREHLALWDDETELSKGKETFLIDRSRWRAMRRVVREREEVEDRRDVEVEERQVEEAKRESEAFLSQQAELFAKMSGHSDKAGGLLQLDDGVPIKLSFGGAKVAIAETAVPNLKTSTSMLLSNDDDEIFKRKRELVPLTYDDDDDLEEEKGMTEEEKLERRQRKVREIVGSIPSDKGALFEKDIRWEKLNKVRLLPILFPLSLHSR